ncbi:F390 synthetase-related protein [Hyphomonas sp.]|uniref:F390 synthetase-related protein n=1 Tax=Hyphomonas sp. TaxID=87 RepID=UPI00391C5244
MTAPLALALTLSAYWRTKARAARLNTRSALLAWQSRRLTRFLTSEAPRAEAFANLSGHPLTDFPMMDKAALMAGFQRYNIAGISADDAWQALAATGRINRFSVGASTGTSGNRGLYLVSDAERYLWLGTLLAKALPDLLARRYRVAVMLPRSSRLYDAANESGRLALRFFDLTEGLETQLADVAAFRPNVLVAPPHALVALARADLPLSLAKVFSGAEVLDPLDRAEIEARFGLTVREIYMATEGLFGVACDHGTLHLCEDCVAFEWEPEGGLAKPLVTDFTRRSQLMIRYRMNDLLRLSHTTCPCGSPLQAVSEIAGRADDSFRLRRADGAAITVTPDILRNAILGANRDITDFRLVQTGAASLRLLLPPGQAGALPAAHAALTRLFDGFGVPADISTAAEPLPLPEGGKLRRVIRERTVCA